MRMNRRLLVLLPLLALVACGGKEEMLKPSPLPDIYQAVKFNGDWSVDTGAGTSDPGLALVPAVTGDAVYTADEEGRLEARQRKNGKRLWKEATHLPFSAGPAVGYNQLFVGTRKGQLLAYSAGNGDLLWRAQLGGEVLAVPAVNGDAVVVKSADGHITLLDRLSGTVRWVYDGGGSTLALRASSRPLLLDDAVLVGLPSGELVALERGTGQVIWERRVADPTGKSELDRLVDIAGDFVLRDDRIYVGSYQGRLVALDLHSGQFTWQQPASTFQPLAASEDNIFLAETDGRVVAVRRADGVVMWRLESLRGREVTGGALLGDWLLVGDFEGWVHVIRHSDGLLVGRRHIDDDGLARPPVVDDGKVFALGRSGKLEVFSLKWRKRAAAAQNPSAAPAALIEPAATP